MMEKEKLPGPISNLLTQAVSGVFEDAQEALTKIGLVIEKNRQGRHDDSEYIKLGLNNALCNVRLSTAEIALIADALINVLLRYDDRAGGAAWSLGKTFDPQVSKSLYKALELYWRKNDDTAAQILYSIQNTGWLDDEKWLIQIVATDGLSESRTIASNMLLRR